jgi:hypothetical protein
VQLVSNVTTCEITVITKELANTQFFLHSARTYSKLGMQEFVECLNTLESASVKSGADALAMAKLRI